MTPTFYKLPEKRIEVGKLRTIGENLLIYKYKEIINREEGLKLTFFEYVVWPSNENFQYVYNIFSFHLSA